MKADSIFETKTWKSCCFCLAGILSYSFFFFFFFFPPSPRMIGSSRFVFMLYMNSLCLTLELCNIGFKFLCLTYLTLEWMICIPMRLSSVSCDLWVLNGFAFCGWWGSSTTCVACNNRAAPSCECTCDWLTVLVLLSLRAWDGLHELTWALWVDRHANEHGRNPYCHAYSNNKSFCSNTIATPFHIIYCLGNRLPFQTHAQLGFKLMLSAKHHHKLATWSPNSSTKITMELQQEIGHYKGAFLRLVYNCMVKPKTLQIISL